VPCRSPRPATRLASDQEALQRLAEVVDEMKAIDHLHRLWRPPANAVGVELTTITADHGDRRMLRQPGRDGGGGAVRQQVHDAMRHEIDEDGAVAVAPTPGPLINADGLQGWGVWCRGRPH
jgi:hypothetical protein